MFWWSGSVATPKAQRQSRSRNQYTKFEQPCVCASCRAAEGPQSSLSVCIVAASTVLILLWDPIKVATCFDIWTLTSPYLSVRVGTKGSGSLAHSLCGERIHKHAPLQPVHARSRCQTLPAVTVERVP
jgi:hypothetical protein